MYWMCLGLSNPYLALRLFDFWRQPPLAQLLLRFVRASATLPVSSALFTAGAGPSAIAFSSVSILAAVHLPLDTFVGLRDNRSTEHVHVHASLQHRRLLRRLALRSALSSSCLTFPLRPSDDDAIVLVRKTKEIRKRGLLFVSVTWRNSRPSRTLPMSAQPCRRILHRHVICSDDVRMSDEPVPETTRRLRRRSPR